MSNDFIRGPDHSEVPADMAADQLRRAREISSKLPAWLPKFEGTTLEDIVPWLHSFDAVNGIFGRGVAAYLLQGLGYDTRVK